MGVFPCTWDTKSRFCVCANYTSKPRRAGEGGGGDSEGEGKGGGGAHGHCLRVAMTILYLRYESDTTTKRADFVYAV